MSIWIDESFLKQISFRLERFKEKGGHVYNVRCPLCGDSSNSKRKARGYFYPQLGDLNYKCHNCGASMTFSSFLKQFDPNLHDRYCLDRYVANETKVRPKEEPDFRVSLETFETGDSIVSGLKSIDQLSVTHPALLYVKERMLPEERYGEMFYAPQFLKWGRTTTDELDEVKQPEHPRLILPWYNVDGNIDAYQARAFGKEKPKYFTVKLNERQRFYGWNRLNSKEKVYVVEGPIDSMFIDNCIAVGTASLHLYYYEDQDITYIPDRDVRNAEVMSIVERLIETGKGVCMLPESTPGKDINDMIKSGISKAAVKFIIDSNTYHGLAAKAKFLTWRKINGKRNLRRG